MPHLIAIGVSCFVWRFMLEAEITGNLEHPGIVPVHGLGPACRRPAVLRHALHLSWRPELKVLKVSFDLRRRAILGNEPNLLGSAFAPFQGAPFDEMPAVDARQAIV